MFGIMEALLSFIRRQVGLRTDAASSTGSLHAKIGDIAENELPKTQRARGVNFTTFNTTNTDLTTVLSVSGRGELLILRNRNAGSTGDYAEYEVTMDGTVIFSGQTGQGGLSINGGNVWGWSQLMSGHVVSGISGVINAFSPNAACPDMYDGIPPIPFNTSLLIKAKRVGTNSVYGEVVYSLEE